MMRGWLSIGFWVGGLVLGCSDAQETWVDSAWSLQAALPDGVETLSAFVRRDDVQEVVAGATVTPDRTRLLFGVPAEVPLSFHLLGRLSRLGPAAFGPMVAYYGKRSVVVPLQQERFAVQLTARPAGLLAIGLRVEDPPRKLWVDLEPEEQAVESEARWLSAAPEVVSYVPVSEGHYRLTVRRSPNEAPLRTIGGLYVRRSVEARTQIAVGAEPEPTDDLSLSVAIEDGDGTALGLVDGLRFQAGLLEPVYAALGFGFVEAPESGSLIFDGDASLMDAEGRELARFDFGPVTGGVLRLGPLPLVTAGRYFLRVRARNASARPAERWLAWNVLDEDETPGVPVTLRLMRLPDEGDEDGWVQVMALDADDRFVEASLATVDFSESDPWFSFPEGRRYQRQNGPIFFHVVFRRPSLPPDLDQVLRVKFQDARYVGTSTAGLTFPPVDRFGPAS
jgi:hypothetical protein